MKDISKAVDISLQKILIKIQKTKMIVDAINDKMEHNQSGGSITQLKENIETLNTALYSNKIGCNVNTTVDKFTLINDQLKLLYTSKMNLDQHVIDLLDQTQNEVYSKEVVDRKIDELVSGTPDTLLTNKQRELKLAMDRANITAPQKQLPPPPVISTPQNMLSEVTTNPGILSALDSGKSQYNTDDLVSTNLTEQFDSAGQGQTTSQTTGSQGSTATNTATDNIIESINSDKRKQTTQSLNTIFKQPQQQSNFNSAP
jgi:hypothetical protein